MIEKRSPIWAYFPAWEMESPQRGITPAIVTTNIPAYRIIKKPAIYLKNQTMGIKLFYRK
jgi:hypothetical protein